MVYFSPYSGDPQGTTRIHSDEATEPAVANNARGSGVGGDRLYLIQNDSAVSLKEQKLLWYVKTKVQVAGSRHLA